MRKKWVVKESDAMSVKAIAAALGVSELTAKILYHRGIRDIESAKTFLEPENAPFNDPFAMKGMTAAVERIIKAIDNHEKIYVYGDYDVDGMSASAILIRTLRRLDAEAESYIPARSEGYGLNIPALEKIAEDNAKLIISVDCGITNEKEIAAVKDKIDVIVTDHHLPALDDIKSAVAVVNPNQRDCPYPEKKLCGAGVAFKLSQALMNKLRGVDIQTYTTDIELAAMATVADLVGLLGENRKIVRMGLQKMRTTDCIGLRALINVAGFFDRKISAGHIAFQIAPRLNSVGRLKSAAEGLKLLLTEDENTAKSMARDFNRMNQERKDIEMKILEEAEQIVRKMREERGGNLSTLVVAGEGWQEGVIGLTASKLVERYNLPTIILTTQDGKISRASCRSIPALNMKIALDSMAELFEQYGGHSQAAGLTIANEKIPEFSRRFDDYVRQHLTDEDFEPILNLDAIIHPTQITFDMAREFEKFEPYGLGNTHPILAYSGVRGVYPKSMGKESAHLSFVIQSTEPDTPNIRMVAWSCGNLVPLVENESIDIAYEPSLESYQGDVRIQCTVSSLEPVKIAGEFPNREQLLSIYNFLRNARIYTERFDLCSFVRAFNDNNEKFSTYTFDCAVKIFEELGLIVINRDKKTFEILRPKNKLDLNNSRTFRLGSKNNTVNKSAVSGKVISLDSAVKFRRSN
ncbi:MAG: single-stranded-DNA-specific exonuclease RecJ [Selenomonadaceae bacterium]|nr:single-stranded-DNA-specific exonuclease RecJ [Selenomonadaceae bacterium]